MKKNIVNTKKLSRTLIEFFGSNHVQYLWYSALASLKLALYLEECLNGGYTTSVAQDYRNWDNISDKTHTAYRLARAKNNVAWALVKLNVVDEFIPRKHGTFKTDKANQICDEFLNYVDENNISLSFDRNILRELEKELNK